MTIALTLPDRGPRRSWPAILVLAFALGLSAGLLLPSGRIAKACSCLPPPPPAQALDESDAVFDGTVARIETVDPTDHFSGLRIHFVVHTQWKGVTEGRVHVLTAGDSAMCGVFFELGRRYIVYASDQDEDGLLETHLCTRTRLWDEDEAIELGPVEPPEDAIPWHVWVAQPPVPGCPRCAEPPPPAEAMADASAVFHGRLVGIEDLGPDQNRDHVLTFENRGWWKGPNTATIDVLLPWSYWFCEGQRWESLFQPDAPDGHIVYAAEDEEGNLILELCGRTRPWTAEEAAALGSPNAPEQATATPTPGGGSGTPQPEPSATPTLCPIPSCPPCAGPRPAEEWLEEADAVFHGRVVRIDEIDCDRTIHFEVDEVWKGPQRRSISIFMDWVAWGCSRQYVPDEEVVVFATEDPDRGLTVPLCFGIVDEDPREALGPGQPVADDRSPVAHFGGRIRSVAPVPGSDLAWAAQGPRVMAVSLARGEDLQRYGTGLMLPGQVEDLAVDGQRGAARVGRTIHLLDLSEPEQPVVTDRVALDDVEGDLGPIRVLDTYARAFIAHGKHLASIDLDSGEILATDIEVCGVGDRVIDFVATDRLLAIASGGDLPASPSQPAKLQIVERNGHDNLSVCSNASWEIEDAAIGDLTLTEVAGQPRLYSMAEGGIAGWDLTSLDEPTEIARWTAGWRPEGFDPKQGDIAVTSEGVVYAALHRWVGSFHTAGEVLRVLATPDPDTGRSTETVHQSLRPLDAPLVAADGSDGAGRLLMAGPEGFSILDAEEESPRTVPLVTDAVDLALHLDDPGPVLYTTSDKASLNGHLLLDPLSPDPYTFLLGDGGAERGGLTVDEGRLVMANLGQTDIRDQKLEIVTVGGALIPTEQSEIDLRDAGPGLLWDQFGNRLVVRRGAELVLYDLSDPSLPVEAARAEIEGRVADLIVDGDWVYALHYGASLPLPEAPATTFLTVLRIHRANGELWLDPMEGATELPFTVHQDGLPLAALDGDRQVLWMAGAIHCPGDPRYLLFGLNVADPTAPAGIDWGWEDLPARPAVVTYADGHLFLGGEHPRVMDVRNPELPTWAGELEVAGAGSLVVHEQTVYAAAGADGVFILQPELAWDSDPEAPTPVPHVTPSTMPPTPTPDCSGSPTPTPTAFHGSPTPTPTPWTVEPGSIYLPRLVNGE